MLQVYLVRHGETEWNVARRIQGQSDSALTPRGEQQAQQVAERIRTLGITHILPAISEERARQQKSSLNLVVIAR